MTETTVSEPEDPRRPQGSWPGVVFILGLLAVGLVTCSQPSSPDLAVKPQPAAAPVAAPTTGSGSAPAAAAPPAAQAPATTPGDISDGAKKILAALGQSPSAKACEAGFAKLVRGEPFGFRRSAAELSDKAKATLKGAASIASVCGAHKIEVGGHTDRSGSRAFNQALSEKRAQAVKDYLVAQGAPAAALSAKGYGESRRHRGYRASASRRITFAVAD